MNQLWLRLTLCGVGVLVGIVCLWAGWRSHQWSLAFLGASQVILWSAKAGSALYQHRRFPALVMTRPSATDVPLIRS